MTKSTAKPKLSDGSLELKLTVSPAAHQAAYQRVLQESAKSVELKGFRKGKAPLHLVEKSLDKSRLYSRVLEIVLPPAYSKAVKDSQVQPIVEPRITPVKMEEGKAWEFTAQTAVYPEVKLGQYRDEIKKAIAKAKKEGKEKDKDWEYRVVMDTILATTEVEPAELMIEEEAHSSLRKLESQLSSLKLTLADYLKSIKKDEKAFHQEYHETARTNLRLEFALKAIVDQENPEISAEELAKHKPSKNQENYVRYLLQKKKVLDILVKL